MSGSLNGVSVEPSTGFRPPQQARSRAALQKLLLAAEESLAAVGLDDFTIADVSERAGVSVGAIYRRFDSKEELLAAVKDRLLTRVETTITEALAGSEPGLVNVIDSFARGLADSFSLGDQVIPDLLSSSSVELHERGLRTLSSLQRLFMNAIAPYLGEVQRGDPMTSAESTAHTMIGACVHRAASVRRWPDGLSWELWADHISSMAAGYLLTSDTRGPE